MPLEAQATVWDILEPLSIRDPDMKKMSIPHLQALFARETIQSLRERLSSLQILVCEGEHDDPCSSRTRDSCPLRELNLTCGHQDYTQTFSPRRRQWKTPLAAIVTSCHCLYQTGERDFADSMIREAERITHLLYVVDAARYLSYHRLREGKNFERGDLIDFPVEAWSHPLANIDSIEALKEASRVLEVQLGKELETVLEAVKAHLDSQSTAIYRPVFDDRKIG